MRRCEFCGKRGNNREITFHHYYPRPRKKRHGNEGVYICRRRHERLHMEYSNSELATMFNNYDDLYEALDL